MSDITLWKPNEADWLRRHIAGESVESIASAESAPVEVVSQIVYSALDRREVASVTVRRARRIAQLEMALTPHLTLAAAGDVKSAGAVAKIVPELAALEQLYPTGGAGPSGSPAARSGQTAEGASDPMRRARYVDLLRNPERDPDLLPALIEAGWSHPAWTGT